MNYLDTWDKMRSAIDQAHDLLDLKNLRDQGEALRYAAQLAGQSKEVVRKCSEIKLRAERRAGELLLKLPKQSPGQYQRSSATTVESYRELGVDKRDASKWQRIASIPPVEFDSWLRQVSEVSTAAALRHARSLLTSTRGGPKAESVQKVADGTYSLFLADPPWEEMTEEEIAELRIGKESRIPVRSAARNDAFLFLWSAPEYLPQAMTVISRWGFTFRTIAFTWIVKDHRAPLSQRFSGLTQGNGAVCLLGVRGKGLRTVSTGVSAVLETEPLKAGARPAETRTRILELVGDVDRVELYGRVQVNGWDFFSN